MSTSNDSSSSGSSSFNNPSLGIDVPSSVDGQLLAAMIYAESRGAAAGGEDVDEKAAIGQTIANRCHYAKKTKPNGKPCANSGFGNGEILSALSAAGQFEAYKGPRWNEVTDGDKMMTRAQLEGSLDAAKLEHLRLSIVAANAINVSEAPFTHSKLDGIAIGFNRATNSPPNPQRMEKLGKAGAHTFYRFKPGRECE